MSLEPETKDEVEQLPAEEEVSSELEDSQLEEVAGGAEEANLQETRLDDGGR